MSTMTDNEVRFLRDVQAFLEIGIDKGLNFPTIIATLGHDIGEIADNAFDAPPDGIMTSVRSYANDLEADNPICPRGRHNLGTMICFHGRYDLGDRHDLKESDFTKWEEVRDYLIKKKNAWVILPLYLYAHSGITMSTTPFGCPWDSGQVGLIYVSQKKAFARLGKRLAAAEVKERARKLLEDEVRIYSKYIDGRA